MKTLSKHDYLIALDKAHTDPESYKIIEDLIANFTGMIRHMKATSLWDVYEYEELITKRLKEPLEIVYYENEQMKKEINELRKKLGMCSKYKTEDDE